MASNGCKTTEKKIFGVTIVSDDGFASFKAYDMADLSSELRGVLSKGFIGKTESINFCWDTTTQSIVEKFPRLVGWKYSFIEEIEFISKEPLERVCGEMQYIFTIYQA